MVRSDGGLPALENHECDHKKLGDTLPFKHLLTGIILHFFVTQLFDQNLHSNDFIVHQPLLIVIVTQCQYLLFKLKLLTLIVIHKRNQLTLIVNQFQNLPFRLKLFTLIANHNQNLILFVLKLLKNRFVIIMLHLPFAIHIRNQLTLIVSQSQNLPFRLKLFTLIASQNLIHFVLKLPRTSS